MAAGEHDDHELGHIAFIDDEALLLVLAEVHFKEEHRHLAGGHDIVLSRHAVALLGLELAVLLHLLRRALLLLEEVRVVPGANLGGYQAFAKNLGEVLGGNGFRDKTALLFLPLEFDLSRQTIVLAPLLKLLKSLAVEMVEDPGGLCGLRDRPLAGLL